MVTALTTSTKSRRVSDTEVRLAGHGVTRHRFAGHRFAALLVRVVLTLYGLMRSLGPQSLRAAVSDRLTNRPEPSPDAPPYDLLRASVNLVVASLLISLGTASGLPLSTTYITFMAAMGAALGDRTWTRNDADQRVAGILMVLGGWVMTGVIAATGAFVMASIISLGGTAGILVALVAVVLGVRHLSTINDPTPQN